MFPNFPFCQLQRFKYISFVFLTVGLETEEESALRAGGSNGHPSVRGDPSLTVWSCALQPENLRSHLRIRSIVENSW